MADVYNFNWANGAERKLRWGAEGPLASVSPRHAINLIRMLDGLTPIEIANCTPYMRLRPIKADGTIGADLLSGEAFVAPKFKFTDATGKVDDGRLADRPDASIEKVDIKTHLGRGWILFREISLSIVVHRPDKVFRKGSESSIVMSLTDFSKSHVLEYGWSGNMGLINDGAQEPETPPPGAGPAPASSENKKKRLQFPDKGGIKFRVTSYNFTIQPDMQVKFDIHGFEDNELGARDAVLLNQRDIMNYFPKNAGSLRPPTAGHGDYVDIIMSRINYYFSQLINQKVIKRQCVVTNFNKELQVNEEFLRENEYVQVKDVLDIFTSDPILWAGSHAGYRDIRLEFGNFNQNLPKLSPEFGVKDISDFAGSNIGEFPLPLDMVNKLTTEHLNESSEKMNAYNFINELLRCITRVLTSNNGAGRGVMPDLAMRTKTIYLDDQRQMMMQIVDKRTFNISDELLVGNIVDKSKLIEKLYNHGIPYIAIGKKFSFIKESNFTVQNDEQMKSLFILDGLARSREGVAKVDNRLAAATLDAGNDFLTVYRSAIRGTLTMIGNFAFEPFQVVYLDFNIPQYNGCFYILSKNETIGVDGFYTTIELQAAGASTGRRLRGSSGSPKWAVAGGVRKPNDWIREMIRKHADNDPPPSELPSIIPNIDGTAGDPYAMTYVIRDQTGKPVNQKTTPPVSSQGESVNSIRDTGQFVQMIEEWKPIKE